MVQYDHDVHIGYEIRRVLREQHITVTEFAKRICCHRKNVYDIFTRKTIDMDRLIIVSEALDYDFINNVYRKNDSGHEFVLRLRDGKLEVVETTDIV